MDVAESDVNILTASKTLSSLQKQCLLGVRTPLKRPKRVFPSNKWGDKKQENPLGQMDLNHQVDWCLSAAEDAVTHDSSGQCSQASSEAEI